MYNIMAEVKELTSLSTDETKFPACNKGGQMPENVIMQPQTSYKH